MHSLGNRSAVSQLKKVEEPYIGDASQKEMHFRSNADCHKPLKRRSINGVVIGE